MEAFLCGLSFGLATMALGFFLMNHTTTGWMFFGTALVAAAGFWWVH